MIKASEIEQLLSAKLEGNCDAVVKNIDDIIFVADPLYIEKIDKSKATILFLEESLCNKSLVDSFLSLGNNRACFCIKGAYAAFIRVIYKLIPNVHITGHSKIVQKSMISEASIIAKDVVLYPNVFIGNNVNIGNRTIIFTGSVIMCDTVIGEDVVIYPNVTIYPKTTIGNRVIIGSSTVIGSDGFGFVEDKGELLKVPHVGSTIIEDDVEIGSNSSIDRGTLGSTFIGAGTKIDNLVQVAHNCKIGKNCILCGMVGLSGSTELGDNVTMGANSGTKGHLKIENNCIVTARSSISKSLPAGSQVKGYPAKPIPEALKIQTLISKLPELYQRIKKLEKENKNNG